MEDYQKSIYLSIYLHGCRGLGRRDGRLRLRRLAQTLRPHRPLAIGEGHHVHAVTLPHDAAAEGCHLAVEIEVLPHPCARREAAGRVPSAPSGTAPCAPR
eukprot:scaffold116733_cov48-Phaeocystis_antarctica.AAC.1